MSKKATIKITIHVFDWQYKEMIKMGKGAYPENMQQITRNAITDYLIKKGVQLPFDNKTTI